MATNRPSRYRSSTSASNPPAITKAAEILQSLLDKLSNSLVVPRVPAAGAGAHSSSAAPTTTTSASASAASDAPGNGYPDTNQLLRHAREIHQLVAAKRPPCPAQDDFRHLRGFQRLLDVLRAFSGFYNPQVRSEAEKRALFELLHVVLAILSALFRGHPGNRRYFRQRVEGGGWEALGQIIASIGLGGSDSDLWTNCQLFGKLLSFSLDDQRLDELCRWVGSTPVTTSEGFELVQRVDGMGLGGGDGGGDGSAQTPRPTPESIQRRLDEIIGPKTVLHNAEIMRTVVGFWESMPRESSGDRANLASALVLATLSAVVRVSFFNLSALHGTGVMSRLLRLYFDPEQQQALSEGERAQILALCRSLMHLGVNRLADAQFLLASRDPAALEFCLAMADRHDSPSFVQFDLSLHGHASVELPSLGRAFPPQSSAGYTFTAWVRFDRFDPGTHTTLFGVFDATQTCFLLGYLERDTRNFILQTSVTAKQPSVRFKRFVFKSDRWYHLALVHKRPKALNASKASLYVNGEFVEQIKASYPALPPLSNGSTESFASFTSNSNKNAPVQAFLGTPRDLSTQVGPGLVFSRWSLASAHLFEDALSDDFLAVHYRLGPRYHGNFQDSLGGFQTYEASAALGLRNELLHPGKDENSDILRAIREKASTVLPENKVLMGTMPPAMYRPETQFLDSLLFRSLSRAAAANLLSMSTKSGAAIAINTAVPSINDALLRSHGVSVLAGDPVLAVPRNFDDSMWRLAGFAPLALKLVERAATSEELVRAVELMFLCINKSWRNSDSMERESGYSILAILIRSKLGYSVSGPTTATTGNNGTVVVGAAAAESLGCRLNMTPEERDRTSFQLLSLVLAFVGYKHAEPLESFIINPLAYRILLIDFDTWRRSAPITQELYYKQFVTFAVMSKYHQFNSRRLLRMRIIKRLLDAMKAESIQESILPHFMSSLESLIKCNYNVEVHRALALFITYAFHVSPGSLPRTPKPLSAISRSSTPGLAVPKRAATFDVNGPAASSGSAASVASSTTRTLGRRQLGVKILEMYSRLLCERGNLADIRRFARAVTNKWLLCLLAEDDPEIVVHGCKILARLLVTHGPSYVNKFGSKTGGFWIMAHRLKHWWDISTLWPICFCVLFGRDVADIDFTRSFDFVSLLEIFGSGRVFYPDALPIITSMLQHGLRDVLKYQDDPDSPASGSDATGGAKSPPLSSVPEAAAGSFEGRPRARSMNLADELAGRQVVRPDKERVTCHAVVLHTVVRFLADLQARSADFREFCHASEYVRLLLAALYPIVVSTDPVSPETELNSKDSVLTFEGGDVIIRPLPGSSSPAPIVRTSTATSLPTAAASAAGDNGKRPNATPLQTTVTASMASLSGKGTPLRKASSFILLTSVKSPPALASPARLTHVMSPRKKVETQRVSNVVLDGLLELVINVFTDQVLVRKEFPGFGLFLKVPPGFQEHQAYFESYVLRNTVSHLNSLIQLDQQRLLLEPKVLTNMGRFALHMTEAIFEGWFMNGAEPTLDFCGMVLEYLQRPDVSSAKSVRLCSQAVATVRTCFLKLVLLRLSDMDAEDEEAQLSDAEALSVLERIFYWQTVLLASLSGDDDYMKLVWYQLYAKLLDRREAVRLVAASIWRIMLVQKPDESAAVLRQCAMPDQAQLTRSFRQLTEVDDGTFVAWVDAHRPSLDLLFFGGMARPWEEFVAAENQRTLDTAKGRLAKRKEKLKVWHAEGMERENVLIRHEMANGAWTKSIFFTEHYKHQRLVQDQQNDKAFLASSFVKMDRDLRRPGAVFAEDGATIRWKLDRTEGRDRMRLRVLPDYSPQQHEYQGKQRRGTADPGSGSGTGPDANVSSSSSNPTLKVNTAVGQAAGISSTPMTSVTQEPAEAAAGATQPVVVGGVDGSSGSRDEAVVAADLSAEPDAVGEQDTGAVSAESGVVVAPEDDFELVDDPNDPEELEGAEDKNRKVIRRLEHGDSVQYVYNISRIIGLEACEGILIIGKDALYLMDNVFRTAAGEIINVWQAPPEERDPFSQIITQDKTAADKQQQSQQQTSPTGRRSRGSEQESRKWRWSDVISISKRRFLFRDVAVEVFFRDGRSYLLTAITPAARDEMHGRLVQKTPHTTGPTAALPNPDDAWRLEALRVLDEAPQTLGSKFGSIFAGSPWSPLVRRWQKGDISNFHYLMLVNTMAGRTFNDLTQYPVFPWVLADYTSEELDLNDPATFRDLSKPMGAQTPSRTADFRERYAGLAELDLPPFHYGTHYSSAMVVASYLIRLPPFVDSYLLLQGGHFDHPDRLFFSVAGAWRSASQDSSGDVRELIPEFFCLPEFLTNTNGYAFGSRQDGSPVGDVVLPPWAKGDPKIFIARHREALESPYVSQMLHQWIDLVFGCKQRGDAAVENLNVFHHLSYHGAIDLDGIADPQERKVITSIIHNFGQTPHQIFTKPHPPRENVRCNIKRLDTSIYALTKLPYPLLESHERVASLIYAPKLDRLLCASAFRVNLPPHYDKFLEWGFADNSVRFYFSENRKLAGVFENLHIGQISCVAFADSKTLVTAGEDGVVSAHAIHSSPGKPVELVLRASLFGHKEPGVCAISASRSLSTLVTVGRDGAAFLWDLNRLEFVRRLPTATTSAGRRPVECARVNDVTGDIMLCAGSSVVLFSVNGDLILDQDVCGGGGGGGADSLLTTEDATTGVKSNERNGSIGRRPGSDDDDCVCSCAFYEGSGGSEWLENQLVFTGHRRGRVNIWRKAVGRDGRWTLEFLRRLDHVDTKSETGANVDAAITCITPMPQLVYTGDEDGRVYEWNLVQRER